MDFYKPSEDTYFMEEILNAQLSLEKKNISFFEMGPGSGYNLQTAKNLGLREINSADINPHSVKHCNSLGFICVHSDLFNNISKEKKFDLIIFNPPYLPEHKYDSLPDTTGGKKGDETIIRFLEQSKAHLKPNGKIFLLTSSLTPQINFHSLGYKKILLGEKNLFQEKLSIWKLFR